MIFFFAFSTKSEGKKGLIVCCVRWQREETFLRPRFALFEMLLRSFSSLEKPEKEGERGMKVTNVNFFRAKLHAGVFKVGI